MDRRLRRAFAFALIASALLQASGTHAATRVNLDARRQVIRGFGGCEAFIIMEAGFLQMPASTRQACMDLGFRDLHVNTLRLTLDARFEQDREGNYFYYVPALQAYFANEAISRGSVSLLFGTPWSPPGWMKKNRIPLGGTPDNLLLPENYETFARYLLKWHRHLEEFYGIRLDYVSPQNEPDANPGWNSCTYAPTDFVQLLRTTDRVFRAEGLKGRLLAPEYTSPMMSLPFLGLLRGNDEARQALGVFAVHRYNNADYGFARAIRNSIPDKEVWMSETCFLKKDDLFRTIRRHLYDWGVSCWCWWRIVGGWETLVKFGKDGSYKVEPPYHTFKAIVNFVKPGMRLVEVRTDDLRDQPIAAVGGDGSFTLALLNTAKSDRFTRVEGLGSIKTLHRYVNGDHAGVETVRNGVLERVCLDADAVTTLSTIRVERPREVARVNVDPPAARAALGRRMRFGARVLGSRDQRVRWSLIDEKGKGGAGLGRVDAEGNYDAPKKMPDSGSCVFLKATSLAHPDRFFCVPICLTPTPNLALGKRAFGEGHNDVFTPEKAVDGMLWTMFKGDWVVIDLGEVLEYDRIELAFPSHWKRRGYRILDSRDGESWSLAYETADSNLGEDVVTVEPRRARYVKLDHAAVCEIEVYRSAR